jgi:signal transduction histidine kinase
MRHLVTDGADTVIDRYGVLEEPTGRDLQALVDLAAQVCEVPHAAINLITTSEQHQIAAAGFDASVCAREDSMCAAVLQEPGTVIVADASQDERFRDNPFVTGEIGKVRFYASHPLTTPEGSVIGRLCVFDDEPRVLGEEQADALAGLAERVVDAMELRLRTRQLEQSLGQLTRVRDELRRSNEKLAAFAGQITHDLRSPLTALLANAELLATEPAVVSAPDLARLADATVDAGRRMALMIEQIHAHALSGSRLRTAAVDLARVADDAVRDLAPVVEDTGAHVEVEAMPTVTADPQQVYAVLLNLVGNALKYRRPGVRPRVLIRAASQDGLVRVDVSDNGPGVPPADRERVFELFARSDTTVPGSGIGLATVRRIVEAHGGRVGVEDGDSSDGSPGTTVWFTLPC